MEKTVIAFYPASRTASEAAQELVDHGFPQQRIHIMTRKEPSRLRFDAFTEYGIPPQRARLYDACVRRGITLLTVNVPEEMIPRTAQLLIHAGAMNADERQHILQSVLGEEPDPYRGHPGYGMETLFDLPPGGIIVEPPEPEDTDIPPGDPIVPPPDPTGTNPPKPPRERP